MVFRRDTRAVRSGSERRVERDWRSEDEACCCGWELEELEAGLEKWWRIEDICGLGW